MKVLENSPVWSLDVVCPHCGTTLKVEEGDLTVFFGDEDDDISTRITSKGEYKYTCPECHFRTAISSSKLNEKVKGIAYEKHLDEFWKRRGAK